MKVDYSNCRDFIDAKEIILGLNVEIKEGTFISGIGKQADRVVIGDNVYIDKDCVILVPEFELGDYSKIYKQCRISGYKPCKIGHNAWIDQNCILNSADNLTLGNNVCVSAYSQLWTHIKYGDVLEGCRFNSTKEMIIKGDNYIGPKSCFAPIIAEKKSMVLAGSIVTKNLKENHIYAGNPAVDVTHKLGNQFVQRSLDEKFEMMEKRLAEFHQIEPESRDVIRIVPDFEGTMTDEITYFNIAERTYTKRRSNIEIEFMKFLLPLAKFTPADL